MSTGGFKLVRFDWNGGRNDSESERVQFILKSFIQEILDSDTGWSLDSNWNETINDITTLKGFNYQQTTALNDFSSPNYMLFLVNESGAKLAIGYATCGAYIRDEDLVVKHSTQDDRDICLPNGLYFSMIPSYDDKADWEIDDGDITLPSSATRWESFGYSTYYNDYQSSFSSFSGQNSNGVTYSHFALVKADTNVIAFFEKSSGWNVDLIKGFLVGEIVSTFAHNDDTQSLSCINLHFPSYNYTSGSVISGGNGESVEPSTNSLNLNDGSDLLYGLVNQEVYGINYSYSMNNLYQIANSNGQIFSGKSLSLEGEYTVVFKTSNQEQLSSLFVFPMSKGGRWCPIWCGIMSSNPSIFGVIEGDGFKGYLDTDVIRSVSLNTFSRGQTFGLSKEFIYIGGGIVLGWDSSNTESLF